MNRSHGDIHTVYARHKQQGDSQRLAAPDAMATATCCLENERSPRSSTGSRDQCAHSQAPRAAVFKHRQSTQPCRGDTWPQSGYKAGGGCCERRTLRYVQLGGLLHGVLAGGAPCRVQHKIRDERLRVGVASGGVVLGVLEVAGRDARTRLQQAQRLRRGGRRAQQGRDVEAHHVLERPDARLLLWHGAASSGDRVRNGHVLLADAT